MPQFRDVLYASQAMYGAALLLNDPQMTDYTYVVQLPFLNMAIYELNESLIEGSVSVVNQVASPILVQKGDNYIVNLPLYLAEIQEVGERPAGSNSSFISLPRKEFPDTLPASSSLLFWCWQNQRVIFNPSGATGPMEVEVKYINVPLMVGSDENTIIGTTSATMFLIYKTAALLAMFVGEDQIRSSLLNEQADLALERIVGVSNKGRQQIMTRHRPFRAGYKSRGY